MAVLRSQRTLARLRDKNTCQVHKHREKVPVDLHHIWPTEHGGPTVIENLVTVCPTAHREIHEYLKLLIKSKGQIPWIQKIFYGHKVRKLAELGYARVLRRYI